MEYTQKLWTERMWSRSDMSMYVAHLTRETEELTSLDVLIKILNDKKIKGSTNSGFIRGSEKAVCFQDAPLNGLSQNVRHEKKTVKS